MYFLNKYQKKLNKEGKFLFLTIIVFSFPEYSQSETYTMGFITGSERKEGDLEYSKPGIMISGAISLAVDEINKGCFGETGHRLDFIISETCGEEVVSVQRTAELWTKNISAYIGPQETCIHEAYMAAAFNLPMISYYCTHYETSDKKKFPTFARTRPPDTQISKSVVSLLTYFQWKHVVLFYLNSTESEFPKVATTILEWLASSGVTVAQTNYWDTPYHYGYFENPFYDLVKNTYKKTRIYVIVGHYYEHLGLLIALQHMNLLENGEYFVIGVDLEQYDDTDPGKYLKGFLKEVTDPVAEKAFQSYFGVFPSSSVGFDNFSALVDAYMERPPFNYTNPLNYLGGGHRQIRAEAAYLYDAVHLYARALMSALDSGRDPRNGTEIINLIRKSYYKSAMGYIVYMDENGDAEGNYTLVARKPLIDGGFGLFPVGVFVFTDHVSPLPVLKLLDEIDWAGENQPIAVPICGFNGENCLNNTWEIISAITGSIALIILLAFLFIYRNWKYEQELDNLLWKIEFREIQIKFEENVNLRDTKTIHPLVRTSQVSLSSNLDNELRYSTIFTQVGLYKGRLYAIKRVHKKCVDLTRNVKKELKVLRDLRHDNLNAFVGACTDPSNICIVTEYCSRGSLRDILENEDVKLDSMFIASLVGDILRGMIYLHESLVRFHGNLHTGNCLVDSRWVVKISDYGLREFTKGAEEPNSKDPYKIIEKCRKLLYRAPEVLRAMSSLFEDDCTIGSQKADVYSFGIILHELYYRNGPFGNTDLSYTEILQRIIDLSTIPFRPNLEGTEHIFDFVKDSLRECWQEDAEERPDFKTIRVKLRPLRKGIKPNIFDNMMAMMEKYANNLEVLVDERTCQLQEEKKKTEALLYEMLPKPVADQLKIGGKIEAESFDCVTIYFSDIVGFTAISAESTPLQIVDLLNDLYTCFDSVIENFDVYKVETIGDAYMVVSGLPLRNEMNHASEIASMSLKLLQEIKQFKIRHRPNDKLLLRIGIHSGPVCAGVVGLKRPRYCLFGDTVNTASRMESSGMPLKIQCSKQSCEILNTIGGYYLIERGLVTMKGKGEQNTYWLLGESLKASELRNSQREKRKENISKFVPKSSLKNKNKSKNPLPRCSSFESSKKLRFASGEKLTTKNHQIPLKILTENDLNFKGISPNISPSVCCKTTLSNCSVSCPCIEYLSGQGIVKVNSQLSVFLTPDNKGGDCKLFERPICHSVPSLCLPVPQIYKYGEQAVSAPASPKNHQNDDNQTKIEEFFVNDLTPLLKVTTVENTDIIQC